MLCSLKSLKKTKNGWLTNNMGVEGVEVLLINTEVLTPFQTILSIISFSRFSKVFMSDGSRKRFIQLLLFDNVKKLKTLNRNESVGLEKKEED